MSANIGSRIPVVEVRDALGGAVPGAARLEREAAGLRRQIRIARAAAGINWPGTPAAALGSRTDVEDTAVVQVEVGVDRPAIAIGAQRQEPGLAVGVRLLVDVPD